VCVYVCACVCVCVCVCVRVCMYVCVFTCVQKYTGRVLTGVRIGQQSKTPLLSTWLEPYVPGRNSQKSAHCQIYSPEWLCKWLLRNLSRLCHAYSPCSSIGHYSLEVHVCICVCVYVCMYVCMYVWIIEWMNACIMYVCMYVWIHECMHAWIHSFIHTCTYMYVCLYVYVCRQVCTNVSLKQWN